jgi:hypothetical protein
MSRSEIYPWSLLTEVGDYFTVPESFKPYQYVSMLISQKNYRLGGTLRYTACKTTYGTIVMLAQVGEELPPHEFVSPEGILSATSRAVARTTPLGNRPKARELTYAERVEQLPLEVKVANLPWWWDKDKFVWNGGNMGSRYRKEDMEARIANNLAHFDPNKPYPDFYNLDENFRIKQEETLRDDEEEEEDWGPDPIFTDEEQASGGDDT